MTKQMPVTAARWRDRPPGKATLEDRAASLMRVALPPEEPDDVVLARVAGRFVGERRQRQGFRVGFRLALGALCVVAGAASVKAYEWVRQAAWPEPNAALPVREPPAKAKAIRLAAKLAHTEAAADLMPLEPAPAVNESPQPPRRIAPPSATAERHVPATGDIASQVPALDAPPVAPPAFRPSSPEPSGPGPLVSPGWSRPGPAAAPARASDEISALDRAISMLRRDHDANAALVALDEYLRRYPNGFLQREALSGKVDALLLLRRPEDALAALESFPFDNHRRSIELRVIRGELRAHRNCALAIADFDAVLGHFPDAGLLERSLYGRGSCRAKTGDQRGAASDFRRYLESFPEGSHAGWVRRWLDSNKLPR